MRMIRLAQLAIILSVGCFAMTNDDVVKMVKAGASAAQIVERINASEPEFVLREDNLRSLRKDGVPEIVIKAMFARNIGDRLQIEAPKPTLAEHLDKPTPTQSGLASPQIPAEPSAVLTNASIIDMVQTKLSPNFILLAISGCTPHFTFDPNSLAELRKAGVSEDVIKEMMAKQGVHAPVGATRTAKQANGTVKPEAVPPAIKPHSETPTTIAPPPEDGKAAAVTDPNASTPPKSIPSDRKDGDREAPGRLRDALTAFYQKYRDSVVTVWSEIGHGSGFIFDPVGLILTNQHVLGASEYVAVQFDQTRKVRASVIASDAERDVAVLAANLDAFGGAARVAPLWKPSGTDAPVVEGERVLAIGSPLSQRKIMTTGTVSKMEAHAIIADLNINFGSSGGPLFNSVGQVVGITTFGAQGEVGSTIAGIIRIEEANDLISQAQTKITAMARSSSALLPVEPLDTYPPAALKQALSKKYDPRRYVFTIGDFKTEIVTPPLKYRFKLTGDVAAANEANKRLKKSKAQMQVPNPLDELRNWAEYVGSYTPVINIYARPKLHEKFWSAFSRAVAAANGMPSGPAQLHFKGDFQRMRLLCDGKEIAPIQPGKVAYPYNVSNQIVQVSDASYTGIYTFEPDAMSASCKMELEITSAEKPNKPKRIALNRKVVQQVSDDFAPYFQIKTKTP